MQYSKIIKTAWHFTNHSKGLIWYGIIPSFFSTLVGICYLIYQFFAFRSSPFFGGKAFNFAKISDFIFNFFQDHTKLSIFFLVLAVIVVICHFILPPLCEGGLVGLISAIHRKKEVTPKDGIVLDPFAGSGTTLKMAKQLGRNYIGIEISKEYCEIAEKRLKQETLF